MSEPITQDELTELKRLAEQATRYRVDIIDNGNVWLRLDNGSHDILVGDMETEDACCFEVYERLFTAANALPALLDEIERLHGLLDQTGLHYDEL